MPTIAPAAQRILNRLAAIDRVRPVVDRVAVEAAVRQHFDRLGIEPLPVRWVEDAGLGYAVVYEKARSAAESAAWSAARSAADSAAWSAARSAAWSAAWSAARSAAWSAAWSAVESAAWSAAWSAAESAAIERWIGIALPFVDAYEAGLWLFFVTADEVIAVPRPALRIVNDRLHCADGPAVAWPNGVRYYFWRGLQVPERIIIAPEALSGQDILSEQNVEIRRVMIERVGHERFLLEVNARPVHQDETGALYRIELPGDEPISLVHVTNSTPEPDGSLKKYVLRVPPNMERAREAVAWTFTKNENDYAPAKET
jgi:hypothetical protein